MSNDVVYKSILMKKHDTEDLIALSVINSNNTPSKNDELYKYMNDLNKKVNSKEYLKQNITVIKDISYKYWGDIGIDWEKEEFSNLEEVMARVKKAIPNEENYENPSYDEKIKDLRFSMSFESEVYCALLEQEKPSKYRNLLKDVNEFQIFRADNYILSGLADTVSDENHSDDDEKLYKKFEKEYKDKWMDKIGQEKSGKTIYVIAEGGNKVKLKNVSSKKIKGEPFSFENGIQPLFYNFGALKNIEGGENIDTSEVTDMSNMFSSCLSGYGVGTQLTNLDFAKTWDVSNVKSIEGIFSGNQLLTNIDGAKNWELKNCNNMSKAFSSTGVTDLNALSDWNVSNVKDMSGMFYFAPKLKDATAINNWKVSKTANTGSMFSLTEIEKTNKYPSWYKTDSTNPPSIRK